MMDGSIKTGIFTILKTNITITIYTIIFIMKKWLFL